MVDESDEVKKVDPALPSFVRGEVKELRLRFEERGGTVVISIESEGLNQNPAQMALMLDFTLEKLLEQTG